MKKKNMKKKKKKKNVLIMKKMNVMKKYPIVRLKNIKMMNLILILIQMLKENLKEK